MGDVLPYPKVLLPEIREPVTPKRSRSRGKLRTSPKSRSSLQAQAADDLKNSLTLEEFLLPERGTAKRSRSREELRKSPKSRSSPKGAGRLSSRGRPIGSSVGVSKGQ